MHAVSCLELSWCCVTVAIGCACLATGLSFCNMPSSNARSRPRLCDRRFPWHGRLPRPVPSLLRGGGLPKRERERRLARVRSPAIHCHNAVLRSLAVRLTISRVNLRIKKLPHRLVRAWRRTGCPPALLASVQPTGRSRRVRCKQHGTRLALRALHEEQRSHPPPTGVGSFPGPRWKSGRNLRRKVLRRVETCVLNAQQARKVGSGGPTAQGPGICPGYALPLARQTDRPESADHQITRCEVRSFCSEFPVF